MLFVFQVRPSNSLQSQCRLETVVDLLQRCSGKRPNRPLDKGLQDRVQALAFDRRVAEQAGLSALGCAEFDEQLGRLQLGRCVVPVMTATMTSWSR